MSSRAWPVCIAVLLSAPLLLPVGAGTSHDAAGGSSTARYVATPGEGGLFSSEALGFGLGEVVFTVPEGAARVSFVLDDAVSPETEMTAVFHFGDAPIRLAVTFCNVLTRVIPEGATAIVGTIGPLGVDAETTCPNEHAATTGTVTASFS